MALLGSGIASFSCTYSVSQVGNEDLAKDLYTHIQKTLDAMIDGNEDEKKEAEEKTDEPSKAEADKKDE